MLPEGNILVLAPHTDDGELGCGATIAKWTAGGSRVYYAAFSLCAGSLPEGLPDDTLAVECRAATHTLGIAEADLRFFDLPVRQFGDHRQQILDLLIGLREEWDPAIIFTPSASDLHQDHQVIHAESLRAFRNKTIIGYELPWNQRNTGFNHFVGITEDDLHRKIEALAAYKSQAYRSYMQHDFTRALARVRGVQSGTQLAEAFEIYSMVTT